MFRSFIELGYRQTADRSSSWIDWQHRNTSYQFTEDSLISVWGQLGDSAGDIDQLVPEFRAGSTTYHLQRYLPYHGTVASLAGW